VNTDAKGLSYGDHSATTWVDSTLALITVQYRSET
jgi:hypothetical protein